MISKKTAEALGKKLHIDPVKLKAAIDDEKEVDIDIPDDVTVFTKDELSTRDKVKYDEGKTVGVETAVKDFKKAKGLDFKGKDLESLHDHLSTKGEDKEVVEKLRTSVTTAERERDEARAEAGKIRLQSKIESFIPELNNGMNKAEALSVLQANGYDFKEEGGKVVAYRNGEKVKDGKLQTDVAPDVEIKRFLGEEKKWLGETDDNNGGAGGRGGGDSRPKPKPIYTKASEVEKAFNEKHGAGASMGTEHDYAGHLQKVMEEAEKAGTPLVMD